VFSLWFVSLWVVFPKAEYPSFLRSFVIFFFLPLFFFFLPLFSLSGQFILNSFFDVHLKVKTNRLILEFTRISFISHLQEVTILALRQIHLDCKVTSSDCIHIVVELIEMTCFLHVIYKGSKAESNECNAGRSESNLVVLALEVVSGDCASVLHEELGHLINTVWCIIFISLTEFGPKPFRSIKVATNSFTIK